MCGIIGYTGNKKCYGILKKGLARLEYRGYDSSGMCFVHSDGDCEIFRRVGVGDMDISESAMRAECGMGHTRWATHGKVCTENAHPHKKGRVVIVHNGIIENYAAIKQELSDRYDFSSSTDTEVLCALIDDEYKKTHEPIKAMESALAKCSGSYAVCAVFDGIPSTLFLVRSDSPLVIGVGEDGMYAASDITALSGMADRYFIPDTDVIYKLTPDGAVLSNSLTPTYTDISSDISHTVGKGEYEHYMLKEIFQSAEVVPKSAEMALSSPTVPDHMLGGLHRLSIVGCGTAMHAGLCAAHYFEKYAEVNTDVFTASEYRYRPRRIEKGELILFISQSGETADTVGAMRRAKSHGAFTVCVVNTPDSTLCRECDAVIRTYAGTETSVASTKAFSAQLTVLMLLAYRTAYCKGFLTKEEYKEVSQTQTRKLSGLISSALSVSDEVRDIAKELMRHDDIFFIGRGIDGVLCKEASLKLKEISYLHSEACEAGELKHGTISLISDDVPVVAIVTQKEVYSKMETNIKEVLCRGGKVYLICAPDFDTDSLGYECKLTLPDAPSDLLPYPTAILFQLLAYHTAFLLGRQVDKPRNLAKSVTVE